MKTFLFCCTNSFAVDTVKTTLFNFNLPIKYQKWGNNNMVLAVFRSRTETLNFASILRSYGVSCGIINTPRRLNVSCGISVQFNNSNIEIAKSIISRRGFSSFAGFYNN